MSRTQRTTDPRFTWDVTHLFTSETAWRDEKNRIAAELPRLADYQGTLGDSAQKLADALDALFEVRKQLSRVRLYAQLKADEDTRDPHYQGLERETVQLAADFGTVTAFFRPEILRIGADRLAEFLAAEPRLEIYRQLLDDICRRAAHTLSEPEERLLAASAPLAGAPQNIFDVFINADFPYPKVVLSDGREVIIDTPTYEDLRASENRADRERVMSAYLGSLGAFGNTLGTVLDGSIQKALFITRARNFSSAVEMALFGPNIPVSVYTRLVEGVRRRLSTLHRYLRLRQRILGVDQLHYHDLYAPLLPAVSRRFTPEEARALIVAAMAPLGEEYAGVLEAAFDQRWMDWFPAPGKRSGAYNNGAAYDVHPYILLNYNGRYKDVSTVAHELGHALHSYYSNTRQPYVTSGYTIFLAEVASTFNESLLIEHMLHTATDRETRLSLLGDRLERMRGTLFRQVQFADFELTMHQMAQHGEPITGETLANLYLAITRDYYGHASDITIVDDYVAHEWSYVSHFYREFYVYQYATSLTAAEALARRVKDGDQEAVEQFLGLISAGSSDYPIELLRRAGVDMTSDEPLEATLQEMERVIDEMESLLAD